MKKLPQFQEGEYPIKQVIFTNLDSVLGSLFTGLLKDKWGRVDIIHALRNSSNKDLSDADMLMLTTRDVVSTCWDSERTIAALPEYLKARGWTKDDVRVYELGHRIAKL